MRLRTSEKGGERPLQTDTCRARLVGQDGGGELHRGALDLIAADIDCWRVERWVGVCLWEVIGGASRDT
jgi:hypothetical protein